MSSADSTLPLTLEAEAAHLAPAHYVFVELRGPIPVNASRAWQQLHALLPQISAHNEVTAFFSLYKMEEDLYRAGVAVRDAPQELPAGVDSERFAGGKYRKFVLRGPYELLGPATGAAFERARAEGFKLRDDFMVENYVNDPRQTPPPELITEILFPVA